MKRVMTIILFLAAIGGCETAEQKAAREDTAGAAQEIQKSEKRIQFLRQQYSARPDIEEDIMDGIRNGLCRELPMVSERKLNKQEIFYMNSVHNGYWKLLFKNGSGLEVWDYETRIGKDIYYFQDEILVRWIMCEK